MHSSLIFPICKFVGDTVASITIAFTEQQKSIRPVFKSQAIQFICVLYPQYTVLISTVIYRKINLNPYSIKIEKNSKSASTFKSIGSWNDEWNCHLSKRFQFFFCLFFCPNILRSLFSPSMVWGSEELPLLAAPGTRPNLNLHNLCPIS